MTKQDVLRIVADHVDAETLAKIEEDLPTPDDEYERQCEDAAAAAFEDAAHGFDFDENHHYDPNTGMSEYDFDPGIEYNDAGEPKGYC